MLALFFLALRLGLQDQLSYPLDQCDGGVDVYVADRVPVDLSGLDPLAVLGKAQVCRGYRDSLVEDIQPQQQRIGLPLPHDPERVRHVTSVPRIRRWRNRALSRLGN